MLPRIENDIFGEAGNRKRFGAGEAREILDRAAAEQYRLERELDGSYTFEELEEMAAEAGISTEALRKAIGSRRRFVSKWRDRLGLSPVASGFLVTAIVIGALVGLPLFFPDVAYALVFATVLVLLIAVLVGA